MTTLVVCLDRTDDIGTQTDINTPISGWETVLSLVADVGLSDPEDSSVNTILEGLRITQELRDNGESADIAIVSGSSDSVVTADRAVAQQIDELVAKYDPESAIVVLDSAEDERLVPIVESRIPVDSVNRVVVRQARDLESTYYLLKQFLADEELRQTTLVPLGVVLIVFPALAYFGSIAFASATITAVIGAFLVYKGLGAQEYIDGFVAQAQNALYSGQVSVVTYVIGIGLALIGVFFGLLDISEFDLSEGIFLPAMQFAYGSVPWLTAAALTATIGRLLDKYLDRSSDIKQPYLNLPFLVVSVGLVVRGFSAYFLERSEIIDSVVVSSMSIGPVSVSQLTLAPGERLAIFVAAGILISLVGVQIATRISQSGLSRATLEIDNN
ncbi:DUF373 family protein [Salinarchaeum sp. IM2453]|uniref:DUF373 family protein n=1 Tax=Salinarchaeum sp. IM2453 TaxID=2862870 RepID=UPI001C82D656|nr:DUF373 family protein [Salinarchaeum sp. IM2453]QZA87711.1 DUF373 family protein [Salinarchaeum sp. IM2453]